MLTEALLQHILNKSSTKNRYLKVMIYHNFRLRLRICVHIDIDSIPIELAGFAYPEDAENKGLGS